MKRFFTIIASALLVLSAASCDKDSSDFPPYYKLSTSRSLSSGTFGSSDFSNISKVTDQYVNVEFSSEDQAVATYNDVLSKTRDVDFTAPEGTYFKLTIEKYVSKREDEHSIRYDADPSYKSPVGHIWDDKGSRDL